MWHISLMRRGSGFYSPTSLPAKVSICLQTIVGHGALDFGLIKINQTKSYVTVVTDRWSRFFKVPKRSSEEFEVDVPLNLMEPTTKHELIDIEYIAHVSHTIISRVYVII